MKLLVEINGVQELVELGDNAASILGPNDVVLWDERVDGEIPSIEIGKMEAYLVKGKRKLRILDEEVSSHKEAVDKANQEILNRNSKKYLAETDWLIVREVETGVSCSQEIKDARVLARSKIVE